MLNTLQLTQETIISSKNTKFNPTDSAKIKCIISQNNIKTTIYLNKYLTIKDIKILILKKLELDDQEENCKSNLTKSDNCNSNYRNKNPNKLLNNSNMSFPSQKDKNSNIDKKTEKEEKSEIFKSVDITSNGKNKKINLFFKGKELVNDEEKIGNLISNNGIEEIELSVIILSLNDSSIVDENKTKEKLINKISNKCPYHKTIKELFICTSCNIAFCKYCSEKHKYHEIIERKDIIKFNNELKNLSLEMNKKIKEANLQNIYETKNNKSNQYNHNIEKLQNRFDNIKKIQKGIINNYKRDIDKSLPYLLEYKEKVEELIEKSYNLETIQDDQQFIDYYFWYLNIKQKEKKIEKEIEQLKKIHLNFEEMMNYLDEKVQNIFTKAEQDYKLIKQLYYNNNIENENQLLAIQSSNDNQLPKLNLLNIFNKANKNINESLLFSDKKTKKDKHKELNEVISIYENENEISKQKTPLTQRQKEKINKLQNVNNIITKSLRQNSIFSKRKKGTGSFIFEKIEEKSEKEESIEEASLHSHKNNIIKIYNIKPHSQNIIYFDVKRKRIGEKKVIFENLSFEAFQDNHGMLNYQNNFYISGGDNLKIFYKYDLLSNKFIKLKEMHSVHSFHGMLGMEKNIFVIGGKSTKKVEKYNFNGNIWENLDELNDFRIWPCCFGYNNKLIFVFDGQKNKDNKIINIEKIDISSLENKWQKIELNYKDTIRLPFNFGCICLKDNQILIIGGKNNSYNEDKSKINYSYNILIKKKGIEIEKDDKLIFPEEVEFNGKIFNYIGGGLYGDFSSKSHGTFYIINMLTKKIEEINYNDNFKQVFVIFIYILSKSVLIFYEFNEIEM